MDRPPIQTRPFQVSLYLAFAKIAEPLWRLALKRRLAAGKEDPARLQEKFGRPTVNRPRGPVYWFHALSVGESLALLPLIELAGNAHPDAHFLLTTSTKTSAQALAKIGLPARCQHQYAPIDTAQSVRRFLQFWQPEIAIFSELDFWPRLLTATHARAIPMILINSRMSDRSFEKRQKSKSLYGAVLNLFEMCLLQDAGTLAHFSKLGVDASRMQVLGALKSAAKPLPADAKTLAQFQTAIGPRPVWFGAATEQREDAELLAAHQEVLKHAPDTLFILAPRHLGATAAIHALASAQFTKVAKRSEGAIPDAKTQVYIADTMGEMGLWYRLAPVSFIAHSLSVQGAPLRGKNPYEAAALGSMILHGPHTIDFAETYQALDVAGAAQCVDGFLALAQAVLAGFAPVRRQGFTQAAQEIIKQKQNVLPKTWQQIADRIIS